MSNKISRRKFIKTGLALPAAGLVSSTGLDAFGKEPPRAVYRTLGKTGLKVSGVGYGIGFVPIPEVVSRALDMGINYFDTARVYGDSEKVFAGIIKGRDRSKIIISSKSSSFKGADVLNDIDTSLKALGTDYVDVWLLHGRDKPDTVPDDVLQAMQECKKSGKARFVGVSCHDPNGIVDYLIETKTFDIMQTTYSFPIGGHFRDMAIKKAHEAGIGVVAMKVVVALSGLNLTSVDNPPATKGEGPLSGIKWVLNNPAIGTTVPFMKTIQELEMNFRAMSEPYLPSDEKTLYVMNEKIRPSYCRMCYQCSGKCPHDMPVTDVLRFLAYNDYCGNYHQARMSFMELPEKIQGVRCSDCSDCVINCPNGVQVHERLVRAQELLA